MDQDDDMNTNVLLLLQKREGQEYEPTLLYSTLRSRIAAAASIGSGINHVTERALRVSQSQEAVQSCHKSGHSTFPVIPFSGSFYTPGHRILQVSHRSGESSSLASKIRVSRYLHTNPDVAATQNCP